MKKIILASFLMMASFLVFSQVDEILVEEITVEAENEFDIISNSVTDDKLNFIAPHTAGDVFKQIPGFNIVKRSNFAIEPTLRLYKREQLNTMLDGGLQISQSCANRMDPMTTRISSGEIEKIEVVKGPYDVRFGQGFGGTINIITDRPKRSGKKEIHGSIEGAYELNGQGKTTAATLSGNTKKFDFFVNGTFRDFENYKAGGGDEVISSFRAYDYSTKIGINPTKKQRIQLAWRQSFADNVRHAGLPMDAAKDDGKMLSADYKWKNYSSTLKEINVKLYSTWVDHLMTNEYRPNYKFAYALAGVSSHNRGARTELVWSPFTKLMFYSGADYKFLNRDGQRDKEIYINACTGDTLPQTKYTTDLIWQNSITNTFGGFQEVRYNPTQELTLNAGIRVNYSKSEILNPEQDFAEFYGDDLQPKENITYNAFATAKYKFNRGYAIKFSAGKGTRVPDLLELFINHFTVGKDPHEYFGNPLLKPEQNYQADFAITKQGKNSVFYVDFFYAYITDYITSQVDTTLPRKFLPCKQPAYAKRFVNIDEAYQYGYEFGFERTIFRTIFMKLNTNFTFAHNVDWDEPLPEIAPLTTNAALGYDNDKLHIEFDGRFVGHQDRVATSFGEMRSPNFNIYNFSVSYKFKENAKIGFAIDNIFDTKYYDHLSRPYKNMMDAGTPYYDMGRNIKFSLKLMF